MEDDPEYGRMTDCKEVLSCFEETSYSEESKNVCRINVHARTFDWLQPSNRNKGGSGTGTGFILDCFNGSDASEIFIVTAHHVVAHAVQIRVNFAKISPEYYDVVLVGCNPDMDFALLALRDDGFRQKLPESVGLKAGDSDLIQPPITVTAHGFAFGKPHMQTTKGVVSGRIDSPSRLQIDVAVNPGNSGGPLLDGHHRVIGLVTSGRMDAQGINYVAPIREAIIIGERILAAWKTSTPRQHVSDRLPSFNCTFTKANRVISEKGEGVVCTSVHPLIAFPQTVEKAISNLEEAKSSASMESQITSLIEFLWPNRQSSGAARRINVGRMDRSAWIEVVMGHTKDLQLVAAMVDCLQNDTLRNGDLVVGMNVRDGEKCDVDLQMTCDFPFWGDRLGFPAILDRLQCVDDTGAGDTVFFDVYRRADKRQTFKPRVPVPLLPHQNTFRRMFPDMENVDYMVMGGIFVMAFVQNHIPFFERQPLQILMGRPQTRHASILIVTHILPESAFNECESIAAGDVLVSVGASTVTNLSECRNAWKREMGMEDDHVVTISMRDGTLASATVTQLKHATEHIMSEYENISSVRDDSGATPTPPESHRLENNVDEEVTSLRHEIESLKIELAEAQSVKSQSPAHSFSDDSATTTRTPSPALSLSDDDSASVSSLTSPSEASHSATAEDREASSDGSDMSFTDDALLSKGYEDVFAKTPK